MYLRLLWSALLPDGVSPWSFAGQSVRTRRILQEAHDEGRPCPGPLTQTKPCPIRPCYTWLLSNWSSCTVEVKFIMSNSMNAVERGKRPRLSGWFMSGMHFALVRVKHSRYYRVLWLFNYLIYGQFCWHQLYMHTKHTKYAYKAYNMHTKFNPDFQSNSEFYTALLRHPSTHTHTHLPSKNSWFLFL